MTARIPQSVREEQLNALPNMRFSHWVSGEYTNNRDKAVMVCDACGEPWACSVYNLLNGRGCPAKSCRYAKIKLSEMEILSIKVSDSIEILGVEGDMRGNQTRFNLKCKIDGHVWTATYNRLQQNSGCIRCGIKSASMKNTTPEATMVELMSNIAGIEFLGFEGSYRGVASKCKFKCAVDGVEWNAKASSILQGTRCPQCAEDKLRSDPSEVVRDIEAGGKARFVKWAGVKYRNYKSVAHVACVKCSCKWTARVDSLVAGRGCPACAETGFNPEKPGVVYTLRSDCGRYVKVGVSNNVERRIRHLRNITPFSFEPVAIVALEDGRSVLEIEKAFHRNFESAGMTGFDGATEWLMFDLAILDLMNILR